VTVQFARYDLKRPAATQRGDDVHRVRATIIRVVTGIDHEQAPPRIVQFDDAIGVSSGGGFE
jgi:hypothetical protein